MNNGVWYKGIYGLRDMLNGSNVKFPQKDLNNWQCCKIFHRKTQINGIWYKGIWYKEYVEGYIFGEYVKGYIFGEYVKGYIFVNFT